MSRKYNCVGAGIGKKTTVLARPKMEIHLYEVNSFFTTGEAGKVVYKQMADIKLTIVQGALEMVQEKMKNPCFFTISNNI